MASVEALGGIAAVHIIIKAVDKATKVIYDVIASLMTLSGIMAVAGAVLGGYLALKGTQAWMTYEDALVRVQKTTNMTNKSIKALDASLREMSLTSRVSLEGLANIAAIAGQLGFRGQEIIDFTDLVRRSMTAWDMEAQETALALGHIRVAYKLTTDELESMAATINALENRFGAFASDIIDVVERASESAANMGVSAEKVAAMGAAVVAAGVDSQRAGTSIRRMFDYMVKSGDIMAEAMGWSMEKFKDAVNENAFEVMQTFLAMAANTEDTYEVMDIMTEIFGMKGSAAVRKLAFVSDEYARAQAVIANNTENLIEFNGEYALANSTLAASIDHLKNAVTLLVLDFGQALAPTLQWIANLLRDNIGVIGKVIKIFVVWSGVYLSFILIAKLHILTMLKTVWVQLTMVIPAKIMDMKATTGLTMATLLSKNTLLALIGVGMMAFTIFAVLGDKMDWLSAIIIAVTIAMAIMKAVMGDLTAAARGLAAAGLMIGLSLMWDSQMDELDQSLEDVGDIMNTDDLNLNTEALKSNTEVVSKVNAKDMAVSIPVVINFGTEIAGMTKEEFEEYSTNIVNDAIIDALRKAGMFEVGG